MKKPAHFILLVAIALAAYVASACGAAPASDPHAVAPKVLFVKVAITGTVQSMDEVRWVIDGAPVTVDMKSVPGVKVGDTVTVQGTIGRDGTVVASHVQAGRGAASVQGSDTLDPSPEHITPEPSGQPHDEVSGMIEAVTDTSITINGQVYQLTNLRQVEGILAVGAQVTLEFITNPDGTLTVVDIEVSGGDSSDGSSVDNSDDPEVEDQNDDTSVEEQDDQGENEDSQSTDDQNGDEDGSTGSDSGGTGGDSFVPAWM